MIDKMLEKLQQFDNEPHEEVCTSQMKKLLLSAKPEWDAMVKRVEALEEGRKNAWDRMDAIVAVSERIEDEFRQRLCTLEREFDPEIRDNPTGLDNDGNLIRTEIRGGQEKTVTEEKPSECDGYKLYSMAQEVKQDDTITIPRAVAEEYIEWINGGGCAFEDGVENLRNAIKKSLGR